MTPMIIRMLPPMLATAAMMLAHASVGAQSSMQPLFQISPDSGPAWFAADDTTRGMDVVPAGDLLVVDRVPVNAIYRINPITGEESGQVEISGINGGTYPLNKIAVSADGRLYVCNLATASSPFKIYYYDNVEASPVAIFDESFADARWGDDIAVTGTGIRTTVAVSGSDNPEVLILSDRDGDGKFTSRTVRPSNPKLQGVANLAWNFDSSELWIRQSTSSSAYAYCYSASSGEYLNKRTGSEPLMGPIATGRHNNKGFIGVGPGIVSEGTVQLRGIVLDAGTPSNVLGETTKSLEAPPSSNANANGSGDVAIDPRTGRIFYLLTNNSISGWELP